MADGGMNQSINQSMKQSMNEGKKWRWKGGGEKRSGRGGGSGVEEVDVQELTCYWGVPLVVIGVARAQSASTCYSNPGFCVYQP